MMNASGVEEREQHKRHCVEIHPYHLFCIDWQKFFFQAGFIEDQKICFIRNFLISFFNKSSNVFRLNW
jgi:hypothetical protein